MRSESSRSVFSSGPPSGSFSFRPPVDITAWLDEKANTEEDKSPLVDQPSIPLEVLEEDASPSVMQDKLQDFEPRQSLLRDPVASSSRRTLSLPPSVASQANSECEVHVHDDDHHDSLPAKSDYAPSIAEFRLPSPPPTDTNGDLPVTIRSEEFYFEDANLVLVSEEGTAFGVHRGVLRRLSSVFANMLEDAQTTPESEAFNGLPFVRLSDPTADLKMLFQVIYDQIPIELIEAPHKRLLSLCDKYSIDSVLRRILVFLLQTFPDTLEGWYRPRDSEQIQEAINIAMAAFKLNMKVLLPSCLYTIMTEKGLNADLGRLSQPMLLSYHRGFAEFSAYVVDFHKETLLRRVSPPKGCNKAVCKENWSAFREKVGNLYLFEPGWVRYPNPLQYLRELSAQATSDDNFHTYCDRCKSFLPLIFQGAQTSVWDSLPRVFGIADSWAELKM